MKIPDEKWILVRTMKLRHSHFDFCWIETWTFMRMVVKAQPWPWDEIHSPQSPSDTHIYNIDII